MKVLLDKTYKGLMSLISPRFKILAYHGVPKENPSDYEVPLSQFRDQMSILCDKGYNVLDLHRAVQNMFSGEILENTIVLTFDDAHESVYENAVPVLLKLGFTATIFVPTGLVGGVDNFSNDSFKVKKIMTWRMLQELIQEGFAIGSHSVTHRDLAELNSDELRHELDDSYRSLCECIGYHKYYFAYPYGLLNEIVLNTVRKSHYIGALCFGSVMSNWRKVDPFLLKRERVLADTGMAKFQRIIDPGQDLRRAIVAMVTKKY